MELFSYGALMYEPIVRSAMGRIPTYRVAILYGYERFALQNRPYPGITPSPTPMGHVQGLLLSGITEEEMEMLDQFEGDEYERVLVAVEGIQCYVYAIKEEYRHLVTNDAWDPKAFRWRRFMLHEF